MPVTIAAVDSVRATREYRTVRLLLHSQVILQEP